MPGWSPGKGELSVATPTVSHCEITCACLAAGIHVLVEKPIAHTLAEADEMIALAVLQGLTLQVGSTKVELFVDKGETFVRAGAEQGLAVGTVVKIVGPTIADTEPKLSLAGTDKAWPPTIFWGWAALWVWCTARLLAARSRPIDDRLSTGYLSDCRQGGSSG